MSVTPDIFLFYEILSGSWIRTIFLKFDILYMIDLQIVLGVVGYLHLTKTSAG